ncbi:MAG: DUF5050 domain-containing protein [Clostridia bacterium]|nr:DUF5050 domain-containing protein [Clostridia bacterium]
MKKILCTIIALLMLLVSCEQGGTTNDTAHETEAYTPVTLSDETLTMNRMLQLQYMNGYLYAKIGAPSEGYLVRYNCTSGNVSSICADPLCFHTNEECPIVGIIDWNVLPDGSVCFWQRFSKTYRNDAGVITKTVDLDHHALYNPASGKKTMLYEHDGSGFTGPELYDGDYRFYSDIIYDEKRELYVTGLYRMNLKNGDIKLLVESASTEKDDSFTVPGFIFMARDNRVYLSDGASVFSVDYEGENRITHFEGVLPENIHSDGEFVYYQRDDGIYRRRLDGGAEEHIVECDNMYGNLTLTTNWIYWQAGDTITLGKVDIDGYAAREAELSGGKIYRCAHDGSNLTQVAEMNGEYEHLRPTSMTVAGEYIYATYTGWQDKNGDSTFTQDEQLASAYGGDHLPILRIDVTSGEITMIDLK